MLARRLPGILPAMTDEETLEVSTIWSVAGLLPARSRACCAIATVPGAPSHDLGIGPDRRRQPAASRRGDPGPSGCPFPGRTTRVPQHVLESLRQPLEDGHVAIARASRRRGLPRTLPARSRGQSLPARLLGSSTAASARRPSAPAIWVACHVRCSTGSTSTSSCRLYANPSSGRAGRRKLPAVRAPTRRTGPRAQRQRFRGQALRANAAMSARQQRRLLSPLHRKPNGCWRRRRAASASRPVVMTGS